MDSPKQLTIAEMERLAGEPVVVADDHGVITFINERFEQVLGWRPADLLGKPLTMIIPVHLRDAHHMGFSRFLTTEKPTLLNTPLRLQVVAKGGEEMDAEHVILAEKRDGRWIFAATIRPIHPPSHTSREKP